MIRGRPERAQYDIRERRRSGRRRARLAASVTSPDSLQTVFGRRRERPDRGRPGLQVCRWPIGGLPAVIQDERQPRHGRRGVAGRGELVRPHDQVVAQAGRRDRPQPADDVRAAQPVRVRLGLHLVPDRRPGSRRPGRPQPGQLVGDSREVRSVQPTTAAISGSAAARASISGVSAATVTVWTSDGAASRRRAALRAQVVGREAAPDGRPPRR